MKHFKKIFALLAAMMTVLAFVACSKGTLTIKSAGGIKKIKSLTEPAKIIVEYSINAADLSDIKNSISATGQPVQLDLSKTALTEIGWAAFSGCTGLTSITIPDSVTEIGGGAFEKCTGLTSITIGNGVTEIGDGAFYECTRLTSITIPDSVTKIGYYAFSGCTDLTDVKFENTRGWVIRENSLRGTNYRVGVDLTDASKNAIYLKVKYNDATWTRR